MFYTMDEQDEVWIAQVQQYLNIIDVRGDSIDYMCNVRARMSNFIKKINEFKQKQQENEIKKQEIAQKIQEQKGEMIKNKKEV